MQPVTCRACGAEFEASADLPSVFTCGSCGADVRVVKPTTPPRQPPRRVHRPDAPAPRSSSRNPGLVLWLSGGGVLALVAAFFLFRGGEGAPTPKAPTQPSSPSPSPSASPPPSRGAESRPLQTEVPIAQTPAALPKPTPPADDESGSTELVRFKTRIHVAKSPQEWVDAAQFGRKQLETVRAATPASPEIREFETRITACLKNALAADPDFAPAHAELGDLRCSKNEVDAWLASKNTPSKLAAALEEVAAAADKQRDATRRERNLGFSPDVAWLAGPDAGRFGAILGEGTRLFEDRSAGNVSWFYTKAEKAALRVEGELGDYFKDPGQENAFDPFIVRPYLILVQKDPKERSVDRAYEIVQMLRTLEDTWRRRYAKEIDFSGSMSAPPVIFLRSREDYVKYQQRHETVPVLSAGHYEPTERRIIIYKSTEEDERNVIFHEGTHMLFDHKNAVKDAEVQSKQSMWFSEGIAEYFGGHGKSAERDPVTGSVVYEPGRINDTRMITLTLARAMKRLIKFDELVAITREEWSKKNNKDHLWAELTYAQGWALVYYLNHGEGGKYAKDWLEYMRMELNGKSGMEAFKQVFGKYGLDTIEKGYLGFLDFVLKKHREKKIVEGKIVE